ncbi:MAG: spore maturation protein [Christensenellaceae bacterium]|nr:spore maturation protein [Christensenellaceae bacterium]
MSAGNAISQAALPVFVLGIVVFGWARGVDLFDCFAKGARAGIGVVFRVMPYVVGMVFAVDIFEAAGGFTLLSRLLARPLSVMGIPPEVLTLFLMRPFSGGASTGLLAALYARCGPDSFAGRVASTFMGSSETLFYTVSLYFGSVGITKTRYVVPVALVTDAAGLIISCLLCRWFF